MTYQNVTYSMIGNDFFIEEKKTTREKLLEKARRRHEQPQVDSEEWRGQMAEGREGKMEEEAWHSLFRTNEVTVVGKSERRERSKGKIARLCGEGRLEERVAKIWYCWQWQ
jgi:hypothetical protein